MLDERDAKLAFETAAVTGLLTIRLLMAGIENYTPDVRTVVTTIAAAGFVQRMLSAFRTNPDSWFGRPLHAGWFGRRRLAGPVVEFLPLSAVIYSALRTESFIRPSIDGRTVSISFIRFVRTSRFGFGIGIAWLVGDLLKTYLLRRYFRMPPLDSDLFVPAAVFRWIIDHVSAPLSVAVYLIVAERWPAGRLIPILPLAMVLHGFHIAACRWLRLTFLSDQQQQRRPDTPRPTTALFVAS